MNANTLIERPGVVLARERLLSHITHRTWDPSDRTIDMLVRRLRQKTSQSGKKSLDLMNREGRVCNVAYFVWQELPQGDECHNQAIHIVLSSRRCPVKVGTLD